MFQLRIPYIQLYQPDRSAFGILVQIHHITDPQRNILGMTAIGIFRLSRRYHHLLSGLVNDRFFRKPFQKDTLVPLTVRRKPLSVKIQKVDMIDHFIGQLDIQKLRIDIARKQQSLIGCFPGIPLQILLKYHQPQHLLRHGFALLDKVL